MMIQLCQVACACNIAHPDPRACKNSGNDAVHDRACTLILLVGRNIFLGEDNAVSDGTIATVLFVGGVGVSRGDGDERIHCDMNEGA